MAKDKRLFIDMCAGSELKDTQGETLSVEGADIQDLIDGKGRLNDNHGKGFFNSIGRVTAAKKIFKAEDCENDRHKYYWEKIKAPYIYVAGELYNDEDHPNARAAAAIIRNIHREDVPLKMKASVEGGVLSRGISDPSRLARTKIHSVALTFTPANNATLVEPLNIDKSMTNWELDSQLIKSVMHLAETNVPSFRHIERHASANTIFENINKIKDLAKNLGIDIEIKADPQEIINNAISNKIASNIHKINDLVKVMNASNLNYVSTRMVSKPAKQAMADNTLKMHAMKALKDPSHMTAIQNGLTNANVHPDRIKHIMGKIQSHMNKSIDEKVKDNLYKALTAGYGGAGSPMDMTGGAVIQSESIDKKKIKKKIKNKLLKNINFISCDNCGDEQAYMLHQVKCRKCGHNFSLDRLHKYI